MSTGSASRVELIAFGNEHLKITPLPNQASSVRSEISEKMCEIDIVIVNNTEYDFELDKEIGSSLTCAVLSTGFKVIVSLLKKSVSKRFTYQCLFQVNDGKFVEGSEPPSVIKKMSQGVFSVSGPEGSAPDVWVFYCNKERIGEKVGLTFHWTSGATATADGGVSGETTAWTGQDMAPWSNYLEVMADADSWTFTVQQTPASYAVPGRTAGELTIGSWTSSNYDTAFTTDSRHLLKEMNMSNIRLIRDNSLRPTSETIEWTQISRSLMGCEEDYLLVDYFQQGNRGRKFKVFINEATTPPNVFETSGYNGKLHFGFLTFSSDDGAVFFVIHPNSWGPYQHRFKTNTFTQFVKDGKHI